MNVSRSAGDAPGLAPGPGSSAIATMPMLTGAVIRHARRPCRGRARRADRRRHPADLPDLDLSPGRRRPAAGRLRVRPSVNPTRERLERAVAALEGGTHGIAFASGSAATAAIAELAAPGEEVVVGDDVYGGTFRYLERVRRRRRSRDALRRPAAGPDVLWEALNERTRLVWFETPTNPLLKVVDIAAMAGIVARRAAEGGRRPLSSSTTRSRRRPSSGRWTLGADIVFHSATKYLAGHSDTIVGGGGHLGRRRSPSGCASCRTRWAACPGRWTASSSCAGCARSTCAWNGTRPTPAADRCDASRAAPDVAEVRYPGSAGWSRSRRPRQRGGPAARAGGRRRRGHALFTLAESLGGVESLIEVPAAMTHLSVAGSPLEVDPALVRLSVGIEGVDDLIADLTPALDAG